MKSPRIKDHLSSSINDRHCRKAAIQDSSFHLSTLFALGIFIQMLFLMSEQPRNILFQNIGTERISHVNHEHTLCWGCFSFELETNMARSASTYAKNTNTTCISGRELKTSRMLADL